MSTLDQLDAWNHRHEMGVSNRNLAVKAPYTIAETVNLCAHIQANQSGLFFRLL